MTAHHNIQFIHLQISDQRQARKNKLALNLARVKLQFL